MEKNKIPLFIDHNGKHNNVSMQDIVQCLRNLGIKTGDSIMIHPDISVFGKLSDHLRGNHEKLLSNLVQAFKETVGDEGTIIMPTFSFCFLKREPYDAQNTPSTAGVLTEYFRKQEDVMRTRDPNLSFAIWGKDKSFFTENLGKSSFGKDSVFDKFNKKGNKIILFGAPFKGGATFVHHIEDMFGVSYRYKKSIRGTIIDKEKTYQDVYEYNITNQDKYIMINGNKFISHLKKKNILTELTLGNGLVQVVDAQKYFTEGTKLLTENEHSFIDDSFFTKSNNYSAAEDAEEFILKLSDNFLKAGKQADDNYIDKLLDVPQSYFSDGQYRKLDIPVNSEQYNFKSQLVCGEVYIPGFDRDEFLFICGPDLNMLKPESFRGMALAACLAKHLGQMPIKLRYSYRFIFMPKAADLLSFPFFLKDLYPKIKFYLTIGPNSGAGGQIALLLPEYLNMINIIEHNGIFLRQERSCQPRLNFVSWEEWFNEIKDRDKPIIGEVYKYADSRNNLLDISNKIGLGYEKIKETVDMLLRAGFLKEVIY